MALFASPQTLSPGDFVEVIPGSDSQVQRARLHDKILYRSDTDLSVVGNAANDDLGVELGYSGSSWLLRLWNLTSASSSLLSLGEFGPLDGSSSGAVALSGEIFLVLTGRNISLLSGEKWGEPTDRRPRRGRVVLLVLSSRARPLFSTLLPGVSVDPLLLAASPDRLYLGCYDPSPSVRELSRTGLSLRSFPLSASRLLSLALWNGSWAACGADWQGGGALFLPSGTLSSSPLLLLSSLALYRGKLGILGRAGREGEETTVSLGTARVTLPEGGRMVLFLLSPEGAVAGYPLFSTDGDPTMASCGEVLSLLSSLPWGFCLYRLTEEDCSSTLLPFSSPGVCHLAAGRRLLFSSSPADDRPGSTLLLGTDFLYPLGVVADVLPGPSYRVVFSGPVPAIAGLEPNGLYKYSPSGLLPVVPGEQPLVRVLPGGTPHLG